MKRLQCDVRMRILLAARKLFAQRGFDGTTVRQICKEAKSNLALVSYHFGGKESVFFALFDTFPPLDLLYSDELPEDPAEGVRLIIQRLIQFKVEQPEMITIVQQEILMNSPRLDHLSKYIHPVYIKLREYLEKGQKEKLFHFKSVDNTVRLIISIISFPLDNAFISPLLTEKGKGIEAVCEETVRFIFDGLGYQFSTDRESKLNVC